VRVLVLGERSEALLALLREREVEAVAAAPPLGDALAAADVVVLAVQHGAPLPDVAWDVLAAGCLLVAPRAEPAYGLERGIDHLSGATDGELADLAALVTAFPTAFEPVVAMGRLMAQARSRSSAHSVAQ
jgi:hypothetical protein